MLDCDTNCATCDANNPCLTCKSGFGLQNGICEICPIGTILQNQDCVLECLPDQYYYEGIGCESDCPTKTHKIRIAETGVIFCNSLCDPPLLIDPNGQCLTECHPPLKSYEEAGSLLVCEGPCEDHKFFDPKKNDCLSSCPEPSEETIPFSYKICLVKRVRAQL